MSRAALVLCGGHSSRMGIAKAWLPFGQETMLARVVRLLAPLVDCTMVVAAADQEVPPLPEGAIVVRDRVSNRGPLEALATGLTACPARVETVYATGCDVPLLVPAFVSHLFARLEHHDIAVPQDGKFFHPLAAVYRPGVLNAIETLLAADRLRPFFLFEAVDTLKISVDDLRPFDPRLTTLANLNRPADYLNALGQAGFTAPDDILAKLQAE